MSDREIILDAVQEMPETASFHEIVEELLLLDEVKARLAKSERGERGVPHEEVVKKLDLMDYTVIWDEEAIEELGWIVHDIAHDNPIAARKLGELILQKANMLRTFPRFGKIFSKLNRDDVREIPVPPYRVFYHIKDAERSLRILKVWHGARQEPELR